MAGELKLQGRPLARRTTPPTSPRQRTAMDEWPVICWPDTLDTEAPLRLDGFGFRTTTQTQTLP
jgi:hypothetical protein